MDTFSSLPLALLMASSPPFSTSELPSILYLNSIIIQPGLYLNCPQQTFVSKVQDKVHVFAHLIIIPLYCQDQVKYEMIIVLAPSRSVL